MFFFSILVLCRLLASTNQSTQHYNPDDSHLHQYYELLQQQLTLTRAPITPRLVSRRYSNGRVLLTVCRNGYRKRGTWACKNAERVSGCDATHWRRARALQTRFDWCAVRVAGFIAGYMLTISCRRAAVVPNECHSMGANSGTTSRFLL